MASLLSRFTFYHFSIIFVSIHLSQSANIVCDSWRECRYSSLTCTDHEDCNVLCTATQTCYGAVIYCPIGAKCNVECSSDWKSCEYLYVDAHISDSLHMYCSGDTCNSANIYCPNNGFEGEDHLCKLDGDSTLKDIIFHTEEGFYDLDISNVNLIDSWVTCGSNGQYECPFDDCIDGICRDYRLPTPPPVDSPTLHPTEIPSYLPSVAPTDAVDGVDNKPTITFTPTIATSDSVITTNNPTVEPSDHSGASEYDVDIPSQSTQIYNEEDERLEFYVYYNDSNGINMVLGKWILHELLATYQQVTVFEMSGFINATLCVVFGMPYQKSQDNPHCQRFREYGFEASQRRRLREQDLSVECPF